MRLLKGEFVGERKFSLCLICTGVFIVPLMVTGNISSDQQASNSLCNTLTYTTNRLTVN
jgi:hypothetical protein